MVTSFRRGALLSLKAYDIDINILTGSRSLLVIAPHPDDEALGCGAAITAANNLGTDIHILCFTDGGASHPASITWPPVRLKRERKAEFIKSCNILTNHRATTYLLNYPDQHSPSSPKEQKQAAEKIAAMFKNIQLSAIWSSWPWDPHIDHKNAGCTALLLQQEHFPDAQLYFYSVWGRFITNEAVIQALKKYECFKFNASRYIECKKLAVLAHKTQMSRLIKDDPSGFIMEKQTRQHLIYSPEYFLKPKINL